MILESSTPKMDTVQSKIQSLKPIDFLGQENLGGKECLECLKQLYDLVKSGEKNVGLDFGLKQQRLKSKLRKKRKKVSITEAPLPQLVTQNFDSEQVWQELELQNNFLYDELVSSVSTLSALNRRLETSGTNQESRGGDSLEEEDDGGSEGSMEDEKSRATGLLDQADEDSMNESDSDLDGQKKLSTFEKRSKNAEQLIKELEADALQPKPWQLSGETTAGARPENALLEEHLMFDHLIRQAPMVTAETTLKLEDIIKQRIKDQAWDDVQRKVRPTEGYAEFKKMTPMNAEKSKESLAEIYEKEALAKLKPTSDEPTVPEYQIDIQKHLDDLFMKLDALSNFHYTPVNASAEIRVVSNLPSIAMEEATPVTMADETLLAPTEIEPQLVRSLKSKEELDATDKNRTRRMIKKKQKMKRLDRVAKGLGSDNIKTADSLKKKKKSKDGGEESTSHENSKQLKSSQAFFAKLQSQVHTQVKASTAHKEAKKKLKASSFKL